MPKTEPKFDIEVKLIGHDGNAFAIMGTVRRALKEAGATRAQLDEYVEEATSGDYDHLLQVTMGWVNVI